MQSSTGSVIGMDHFGDRPPTTRRRHQVTTRRPRSSGLHLRRARTAAPAARSRTCLRARSTRRRCPRPSSRAGAAHDRGRADTTPATATGNPTAASRTSTLTVKLRPRLIAPARRGVQEPVHARPTMACLPHEVRDEQHSRDRHGQREAPRAQDVAAPDEEGRDQHHEHNRERLRLQPDPDGNSEQRP